MRRLASRSGIAGAVLLAVLAFSSQVAWAAGGPGAGGTGGGSIGPSGVAAGAGAPGGNSDGNVTSYTPPPPNPSPSSESSYTWVIVGSDIGMMCTNGIPTPTPANTPGPGGANGPGTGGPVAGPQFATEFQLYGPNGQPVGAPVDECPAVATPAVPPPPPAPPAPAEVWAATPLPASHIDFNPSGLGLTQLPTWMWFTGPGGPVTATVDIRGYVVTTTARPVAAYWWFGDGGSGEGPVGGSESQPSVTHTYVNVGHYVVTLIVAWSGQYTFVGNGVPAETVELGAVDGPATNAPYAVQEVRSVGVAPGSGQ